MGLQGFGGVKVAGEFGFRQRGVDFVVANLMENGGGAAFAALQLGYEVMDRAFGIGGHRAVAQQADGRAVFKYAVFVSGVRHNVISSKGYRL